MSSADRTAAEILFDAAYVLEVVGERPDRVRRYRRAATVLARNSDPSIENMRALTPAVRQKLVDTLTMIAVDEPMAT